MAGVFGIALRGLGMLGKGKKVSKTITSVKPNVPTTKLEKAKSKLAIAKQKAKTSALKLKNTLSDLKEKATKREKKMGGGMMGRRMGYSQGSNGLVGKQKNIDVAAPFGKITGDDFKKLRKK